MRGIERQRHVHVAARRAQIRREALVVLHVARALQVRGVVLAFEFVEQHRGRFAQHVHQHVEPAAMRHADDAFLDALLSTLLDQIVEQRDQRVAAFERETFLTDVLGVQVALETFGGGQLPQQVLLLFGGDLAREPAHQELILQPQALFGVGHMREFRADGAAVGVLELREDFAQLQLARQLRGARAGEEFGIEIRLGEPEVAELQHARARALLHAQRIELGDQVTAVGVDLYQSRNRALLGGRVGRKRGRSGGHARLAGALDDAGLHGRMDLLARAAVAQFLEVLTPLRVDALGVGEELFVQGFNVGSVAARERRRGQQLAKAGSHTGKKSLWTQGPGATKGRYVSRTRPRSEGSNA